MMRVLAAVFIALLSLPALAADETREPDGMVLLTVGGLVGQPNRGAIDAKRDSLLAQLKADFKTGFAFDRAMLLELPQGSVTAQPAEDMDGSDWILALSADGEPLGIGQQGPIWLINTRGEGETVGEDRRGSHVWAVVYMHVGE